MDMNTLGKFVYSPSREWLARKLSNPKRDQDLRDCVARMKSPWKFTVFNFATEYAASSSLFLWRIYHIELSQRPSRTPLPGHDQNEPLVLLILCAKSNHIAREGMHMQRNMGQRVTHIPGHAGGELPIPPRHDQVVMDTLPGGHGGGAAPPSPDLGRFRSRASRRMNRHLIESADSSSLPTYEHRRRVRSSRLPFGSRRINRHHINQSDDSSSLPIYDHRRRVRSSRETYERAGRKIKGDERVSETKQSDAEIIDQILREYTTFGDGDALSANVPSAPPLTTTNNEPGPASSLVEQSSINGRANTADGNSDAP